MSTALAKKTQKWTLNKDNPLRVTKQQTDCGESVYITEACARSIVYTIPRQNIEQLTGHLFEKPIDTFSKSEKKRLLAIQSLFKDPQFFIDQYFIHNEKEGQIPRLAFPDSDPVYHTEYSCEYMYHDYENHEIPAQILAEDDPVEIARFRAWCIKHRDLFSNNRDLYELKLCTEFDIPLQQLKLIDRPNSGPVKVVNEDLTEIKRRIDALLDQGDEFYNRDNAHRRVLSEYSKRTALLSKKDPDLNNRTGLTDEKVLNILQEYNDTIKQPLRRLLITFYKVSYNPELQFSGKLLEQLGLRECRVCTHAEKRVAV